MRKTVSLCVVGTLASSVLLAGMASAGDPPPECVDGRELMFFNLGVMKGASLVDQAWASLGDEPCRSDKLNDFAENVTAAFDAGAPAPGAPQTVLCHYAGSLTGSAERVDELVGGCSGACHTEGAIIGEMAASFYCYLSIELGGLGLADWLVDVDITLCGDAFVDACEEQFDLVAQAYPSAEDPQCLPYTPYCEDPVYEGVFYQAQHNQCVYEVGVIEPAQ